jgi:muramoyltetrapeptide carboxypeptidase
MAMFEDTRVRAIFCTRGGYGAGRLLEKLDYTLIRQNPKILVGFSDITALSLAMLAKAGLVTFAGPMVAAEFAHGITRNAAHAMWEMLRDVRTSRTLPGCDQARPLRSGIAEGPLIGGNLTVFTSLIGTPWMPDTRGAILLFEDVGESVYRIDRMLLQLRDGGILQRISGVLLGSFTAIPEDRPNRELEEVLREYFLPIGVPILAGIPFGHIPDKITLPIGSRVRLDTEQRTVTVLEAVVS